MGAYGTADRELGRPIAGALGSAQVMVLTRQPLPMTTRDRPYRNAWMAGAAGLAAGLGIGLGAVGSCMLQQLQMPEFGFTGGVGITDEWRGNAQDHRHWRDNHYRVEGPVVLQMQSAFADNWLRSRRVLLHEEEYFPRQEAGDARGVKSQKFQSSPAEGSESMRLMYLLSLAAARKGEPECLRPRVRRGTGGMVRGGPRAGARAAARHRPAVRIAFAAPLGSPLRSAPLRSAERPVERADPPARRRSPALTGKVTAGARTAASANGRPVRRGTLS
jgi:hypothetical protein